MLAYPRRPYRHPGPILLLRHDLSRHHLDRARTTTQPVQQHAIACAIDSWAGHLYTRRQTMRRDTHAITGAYFRQFGATPG